MAQNRPPVDLDQIRAPKISLPLLIDPDASSATVGSATDVDTIKNGNGGATSGSAAATDDFGGVPPDEWQGSPESLAQHLSDMSAGVRTFEQTSHTLQKIAALAERLLNVLLFDDELTSLMLIFYLCGVASFFSFLIALHLVDVSVRVVLACAVVRPLARRAVDWGCGEEGAFDECIKKLFHVWTKLPSRLVRGLPDGPEQVHRRLCRKYG